MGSLVLASKAYFNKCFDFVTPYIPKYIYEILKIPIS